MMGKDSCLNCPYAVEHQPEVQGQDTTLHCHRYPPHVAEDDFITVWPEVHPYEHCGEHPEIARKIRGG